MNISLRSPRVGGVLLALLATFVCALTAASAAQAATAPFITTIAGDGTPGYSGDGGSATSAQMNLPEASAVDASGDVFIADWENNVIRERKPDGTIITAAGDGTAGYSGDGGPATQAELNCPSGVAMDADGNLLIADTCSNAIRKVDTQTGIITTVAGDGNTGYGGDGGPATQAQLSAPTEVAADARGDLFIADYSNNVIREVDAQTGNIATIAGTGDNNVGYSGDGGLATQAELQYPQGVAVDANGNVFIADTRNNVIREVNAQTGIITTVAGDGTAGYSGDGGPATQAELNHTMGLAMDPNGNLLIADWGNNVIRELNTATGVITTVAGGGSLGFGDGGPATDAQLSGPFGVGVNARGDLFIADTYDNTVREVGTVAVDQTSVDFGTVAFGQSSSAQAVTVTNTGSEPLTIGSASIGGTNAGQFAIAPGQDSCSGATVAPSGTCTIAIQFNATVTGARTAELDIPSNDSGSPTTSVSLSGTSLVPPSIDPSSTSLDFGTNAVGGTGSDTKSVTVWNVGLEDLHIGQATIAGANAGQFAIAHGQDTCTGATVTPFFDTCSIVVEFNPTASGAKSAELDIPSDDPSTPTQAIALTGTGAAVSMPAQPAPPAKPALPTQTTSSAHPAKPLVERVVSVGHPTARQLLTRGEKVRVYCNQACSLNVALQVYDRAVIRGRMRQKLLAQAAKMQPWMRVNVGRATVKLSSAGYETFTVKVATHRRQVADAGSMLLGVYTDAGRKLLGKHWMQVKGPKMKAMVGALNRQR